MPARLCEWCSTPVRQASTGRTRRYCDTSCRVAAFRHRQHADEYSEPWQRRAHPRFALHSATVDPVEGSEAQWPGEAKISGRAIAAGAIAEGSDGDSFHAYIAQVVHTHLNQEATMLAVE